MESDWMQCPPTLPAQQEAFWGLILKLPETCLISPDRLRESLGVWVNRAGMHLFHGKIKRQLGRSSHFSWGWARSRALAQRWLTPTVLEGSPRCHQPQRGSLVKLFQHVTRDIWCFKVAVLLQMVMLSACWVIKWEIFLMSAPNIFWECWVNVVLRTREWCSHWVGKEAFFTLVSDPHSLCLWCSWGPSPCFHGNAF